MGSGLRPCRTRRYSGGECFGGDVNEKDNKDNKDKRIKDEEI